MQVAEIINKVDYQVNAALKTITQPNIVKGLIHLLLILYAARLAPMLPKPAMLLFDNPYFKLFVFSLILWTAQFSPSISILIALSFMITVNYTTNKPLWEFLDNVQGTDTPTTDTPTTDTAPMPLHNTVESQGCYPVRRYDMTTVSGFMVPSNEDFAQAPPVL
jgi:hypothetical protein